MSKSWRTGERSKPNGKRSIMKELRNLRSDIFLDRVVELSTNEALRILRGETGCWLVDWARACVVYMDVEGNLCEDDENCTNRIIFDAETLKSFEWRLETLAVVPVESSTRKLYSSQIDIAAFKKGEAIARWRGEVLRSPDSIEDALGLSPIKKNNNK